MTSEDTHPFHIHFDKDRYHLIKEMIEWCLENVGPGGYNSLDSIWAVVTTFGKSSWLFKNQNDATMFALRWA